MKVNIDLTGKTSRITIYFVTGTHWNPLTPVKHVELGAKVIMLFGKKELSFLKHCLPEN